MDNRTNRKTNDNHLGPSSSSDSHPSLGVAVSQKKVKKQRNYHAGLAIYGFNSQGVQFPPKLWKTLERVQRRFPKKIEQVSKRIRRFGSEKRSN